MEGLLGYVATGVVSIAVAILIMYLQPKAKLVYWSPHNFLFNLTNESVALQTLQTDALTLQNIGRKTACNVDIVMSNRPDFFQFAPAIAYHETTLDNGQFVLRIGEMGPKEFVTLQLLSYRQVPHLLNIRSDAGHAQAIQIQLQRVFPTWLSVLLALLMLVGAGTLIYWLIVVIYRLYTLSNMLPN